MCISSSHFMLYVFYQVSVSQLVSLMSITLTVTYSLFLCLSLLPIITSRQESDRLSIEDNRYRSILLAFRIYFVCSIKRWFFFQTDTTAITLTLYDRIQLPQKKKKRKKKTSYIIISSEWLHRMHAQLTSRYWYCTQGVPEL